jgi:hypothetical protein
MSEKHTPFLPLSVTDNGETIKITAADGGNVAGMQFVSLFKRYETADISELAKLMVRATNAHDDLVAALRAALPQAEACWLQHYGDNPEGGPVPQHIALMRAALARATGGV